MVNQDSYLLPINETSQTAIADSSISPPCFFADQADDEDNFQLGTESFNSTMRPPRCTLEKESSILHSYGHSRLTDANNKRLVGLSVTSLGKNFAQTESYEEKEAIINYGTIGRGRA